MSRVLILSTYYRPILGGVESNAERLAVYLHTAGFGVRVVTKRALPGVPDVEVMEGVTVERLGPAGDRSASGKWRFVAPVIRWLVAHRSEYDVVCVVDYRGVGLAALLARAVTGRPVVFQGQTTGVLSGERLDGPLKRLGVSPQGAVARLVKWPIRTVYGGADALACISRVLEREALAAGVPRDRVCFLPNAIDMRRFSPATPDERARLRQELGWPSDVPVCVFVGRLSREKGVMDLLEAWRLAQPLDAMLAVAGPDMPGNPWDVGPSAREFVERFELQQSVRFLGGRSDVPHLFQAADVAVQPSHFEAQGLSAVEALACGLPVIASAVDGLLDFVIDGRNGRLCPPRDPAVLATALRELLGDQDRRARLAAGARASIVDDYDERAVFGRFAALLRCLSGEIREPSR